MLLYRSPKDKCNVIVQTCYHISLKCDNRNYLMLKTLVYILIKANLDNLKYHLNFVALFRHKTVITSDEDYYLSLFFQAYEFIEKLSYSEQLKVNKREVMSLSNNKYYTQNGSKDSTPSSNQVDICNENKGNNLPKTYNTILYIPIEKLNEEYFSLDFNELSFNQLERMRNDFRIVLKLIESLHEDIPG